MTGGGIINTISKTNDRDSDITVLFFIGFNAIFTYYSFPKNYDGVFGELHTSSVADNEFYDDRCNSYSNYGLFNRYI